MLGRLHSLVDLASWRLPRRRGRVAGRRLRATRALAGLGALVLAVTLAACVTGPAVPSERPRTAQLEVVNVSPYAWHIAVGSVFETHLAGGQSREAVVPAGDYEITQTLLARDGAPASTRRLTARFDPGERYRWELGTLLSAINHPTTGELAALP